MLIFSQLLALNLHLHEYTRAVTNRGTEVAQGVWYVYTRTVLLVLFLSRGGSRLRAFERRSRTTGRSSVQSFSFDLAEQFSMRY